MKIRNKKTGMIGEVGYISTTSGNIIVNNIDDQDEWYDYNSLAELNAEWEDYEEPKWKWYIDWDGEIKQCDKRVDALLKFETKEEAEKAVEKLKAWKRLEDKGFRFCGYTDDSGDLFSCQVIRCRFNDFGETSRKDLELLFGGEE